MTTDTFKMGDPTLTLLFWAKDGGIGPYHGGERFGWGPIVTNIRVTAQVVHNELNDNLPAEYIQLDWDAQGYETNKDGTRSKRKGYESYVRPDTYVTREYREAVNEVMQQALEVFKGAFPAHAHLPVEGWARSLEDYA